MIETRADVTLPGPPEEAFAVVADIEHADWLPAIRRLRHISGPSGGVGARYEVEAGLVGRHLRGVLVCRELTPSNTKTQRRNNDRRRPCCVKAFESSTRIGGMARSPSPTNKPK